MQSSSEPLPMISRAVSRREESDLARVDSIRASRRPSNSVRILRSFPVAPNDELVFFGGTSDAVIRGEEASLGGRPRYRYLAAELRGESRNGDLAHVLDLTARHLTCQPVVATGRTDRCPGSEPRPHSPRALPRGWRSVRFPAYRAPPGVAPARGQSPRRRGTSRSGRTPRRRAGAPAPAGSIADCPSPRSAPRSGHRPRHRRPAPAAPRRDRHGRRRSRAVSITHRCAGRAPGSPAGEPLGLGANTPELATLQRDVCRSSRPPGGQRPKWRAALHARPRDHRRVKVLWSARGSASERSWSSSLSSGNLGSHGRLPQGSLVRGAPRGQSQARLLPLPAMWRPPPRP